MSEHLFYDQSAGLTISEQTFAFVVQSLPQFAEIHAFECSESFASDDSRLTSGLALSWIVQILDFKTALNHSIQNIC